MTTRGTTTGSKAAARSPCPRAALLIGCLLWPAAARAHQVPSPDANNRYLKLTLLPERARLTWTLLVGEQPGAAERRRMDLDGDGRLDDRERAAYGAQIAARMAPSAILDGRATTGWRLADVGVGEPTTNGGTFAVDLVLDAAYADPSAERHELRVDDAAALPLAGEAEVRVEESPGVRVVECHLVSERAGIELVYTFTGNPAAPGERAVTVSFTVDPALRPRARRVPWLAAIAAGAGAAAVVWLALAARRRRSAS